MSDGIRFLLGERAVEVRDFDPQAPRKDVQRATAAPVP